MLLSLLFLLAVLCIFSAAGKGHTTRERAAAVSQVTRCRRRPLQFSSLRHHSGLSWKLYKTRGLELTQGCMTLWYELNTAITGFISTTELFKTPLSRISRRRSSLCSLGFSSDCFNALINLYSWQVFTCTLYPFANMCPRIEPGNERWKRAMGKLEFQATFFLPPSSKCGLQGCLL